jgi:hypothetical protein
MTTTASQTSAQFKPALLKVAAFALLSACMFPFNQTVAPEWEITILDFERKPLPNVSVREVWQQSSVEEAAHEEDRQSDANGHVHFERRQSRSNLLQRAGGCLRRKIDAGAHASCGPSAYLVASGSNIGTTDWDDPAQQIAKSGEYQHSTLVARPRQH